MNYFVFEWDQPDVEKNEERYGENLHKWKMI